MEKMLGGDLVARYLKSEGVEVVFGIIDGTYFGFYSSLRKHGIALVTPRHETCAVHMAGAYARTTGKLGVCMASNGPGVANVLPGIAVENGEGNRVLLITSTRRVGIGYPDRGGTYQYFNQVGVIKPMSKWSGAVPSPDRIPEMMKRALRMSWKGRPGVVHVDIPESILNGKAILPGALPPASYRRTAPVAPDPELVEQAANLLVAAKFPIIHAGSGIVHAQAYAQLEAVAEALHAPVCTSWAGRGVLREDSPLALPMQHVQANHQLRNAADAVLVLGSRVGETDWWGKAPYWATPDKQKFIQVDHDEDILGLNRPVDLAILGDVGVFLEALLARVQGRVAGEALETRKREAAKFQEIRRQDRARLDKALQDMEDPMNTAHVAKVCDEVFPADSICVIDGGNTAVWANFYHEVRVPGTVLGTAKFGMLGAGVAQALGAKVAHPDRAVYCIIGDGAMGFQQQEIETAVRNRLPVVYLVCCDKQWGMVKINQSVALKPLKTLWYKSLGPDETINADFGETRFDLLAQSMGAHGERVSSPKELRPALERCIASGTCAVIHLDVDPVKHMWAPSLLDFKKMHQEPKGR
jgi:acetolactate synthase-1/2/3 large subunit